MLIQNRSNDHLYLWLRHNMRFIADPSSEEYTLLGPVALKMEHASNQLTTAQEAVAHLRAQRSVAVEVCSKAIRKLSQYCSDAWVMVDRRLEREEVPAIVKKRFKQLGERPNSLSSRKWIGVAAKILAAETIAVSENHSVMAYPSATDLESVLAEAEAACTNLDRISRAFRDGEAALRGVNNEVAELWLDTAAWFRFSLRRMSKPAVRETMRRFGFNFAEGGATETPNTSDPVGLGDPGDGTGATESPGGDEPAGTDPSGGNPSGNEPTNTDPAGDPSTGNGTETPSTGQPTQSPTHGDTSGQSTETPGTGDTSGQSTETPGTGDTNGQSTETPGTGGSSPSTGQGTGEDQDSDAPKGDSTQTPPILGSDQGNNRPTNNGRG